MILVGALLAFIATAVLIVLLRPLAISGGLVDVPTRRKSHSGNIPLIGGISIFLGSLIALFIQHNLDGNRPVFVGPIPAFYGTAFML